MNSEVERENQEQQQGVDRIKQDYIERLEKGEYCYFHANAEIKCDEEVILCALRHAPVDKINSLLTKHIPIKKFGSEKFNLSMQEAILDNLDGYRLRCVSSRAVYTTIKRTLTSSTKNIARNKRACEKLEREEKKAVAQREETELRFAAMTQSLITEGREEVKRGEF